MLRTFEQLKEAVEYLRGLGAVEVTVGDVSARFDAPQRKVMAGPGLLDDPEAMEEAKLEFIKKTLAEATTDADEVEYWST